MTFQLSKIPNRPKAIAIVTGANIGLGYHTALQLSKKDMTVIMACRNLDKANQAKSEMLEKVPDAKFHAMELDLSSLASVRAFVKNFQSHFGQLDLLINNAGIMMPPYGKTEDGFESQFGVNYLGHFLLTGLLLDLLERGSESRIVTLSSLAHKWGNLYFDDLNFQKQYSAQKAYGQSKLACLMFAYELQRRLEKAKMQTISLAAHPGIAMTNLIHNLPGWMEKAASVVGPLFFQDAAKGALPTLRAALDPQAKGGQYYGPDGFREQRGKPVVVDSNATSKNKAKAKKLWEVSQKLVNIEYL